MLRYPECRANLLAYLDSLADLEWQKRVWVAGCRGDSGELDNIDDVIHFFYDDTVLAEDARAAVGIFLVDEAEVRAVRRVVEALESVLERHGWDQPVEEYLNSDDWQHVVLAAEEARKLLGDVSKGDLC